ncbi:MAG: queuosine precursor transporter [Clostridiales bacterium]|nr:queuosine precursor transporter [Clostridiales bacterium]
MNNEILLVLSVIIIYGGVIAGFRFFGEAGLCCFTVLAVVLANIEVLILINAFGMEMTLGNVMFASSFLCTDILSENFGKKAADRAVRIGVAASLFFIAASQLWLLYAPSPNDWALGPVRDIFSASPRLVGSSLVVYAVCQFADVRLYHFIWKLTGDDEKYLWLRNNGSTLVSQALNTVLFALLAFGGVYGADTLVSIIKSSYVIFIFTSLLDTPAVYIARRIYIKNQNEKIV